MEQLVKIQSVDQESIASVEGGANNTPPVPVSAEVQSVLTEFSHLFQEPTGLPPERFQDHVIPLVPGAQPFKIRPYRYSP